MAKTEKTKTLERTYNIPLRKEYLKAPKWRRTEKAVVGVRQFLQKHMKAEEVRLGRYLNEELWKKGIRNPPHHVKVTALKDEKGVVRAELFGRKIEGLEKEEKKPSKLEEVAKKIGLKRKEEKKEEGPKEKTKEEPKPKEAMTAAEDKK